MSRFKQSCVQGYNYLNIYLTLIIILIKTLTMRLNKTEREQFRRRVRILIPQKEKSEIVNRFQKEGYPEELSMIP